MYLLRRCLIMGCCALIAFVGYSKGEAQTGRIKELSPNTGTTSTIRQIMPYTDNGDKSRLVHTVAAMNALDERLHRYKQEMIEQLLQLPPLLAAPGHKDDLLDKLNRLGTLLPALQTSLEGLVDTLSLFTEQRIDMPYRVALLPALRFHEGNNSSLASLGLTYSDDTIALDVTVQYLHLYPSEEGLALFAKRDMTPSKHVASRALRDLATEVHRLGSSEGRALTRLITAVQQLVTAINRVKEAAQPVHTGVLELIPLVEGHGDDPQAFQQLALRYHALTSPFQEAVNGSVDVFGSQGEKFESFFSRFHTAAQEARAALVRSALSPHFALTGGVRSFRRLGKASAAGFALAQQIPLAAESGVLWNLSGQYVWLNPENGQKTSGATWGLTAAWMDKLSSFSKHGEPILRRWQWQVGVEYNLRSGLLDRSYGVFVRWRPTERLEDYLLFWMHDDSGENTFGAGVRWMFGMERY